MKVLTVVLATAILLVVGCSGDALPSIHALLGGGDTVLSVGGEPPSLLVTLHRAECQAFRMPAEGAGEDTYEVAVTLWLTYDVKDATRLAEFAESQTVAGHVLFKARTARHLTVKSQSYTVANWPVPASGKLDISTRITGLTAGEMESVRHVEIHWH